MKSTNRSNEIKTIEDARKISKKIMGDLVRGHLTYFNLCVVESSSFSQAYFTPVSRTKDGQGMIFVGDYEKILALLLSHPKVREIEYDQEHFTIMAIFESPYEEAMEEVDEYP